MRNMKKAGLTLLIASALFSTTAMSAFANTIAFGPGHPANAGISVENPTITDVVPISPVTPADPTQGEQVPADPTVPAAPTEVLPTSPAETVPADTIVPTDPSQTVVEVPTDPAQTETPAETFNPLTVPKRVPRLQSTILSGELQQWSAPFVNDAVISFENRQFQSISTYLEGIHGDLLYRTYTAGSWNNWVMNGQQSDLKEGWPAVEAVQYRFAGPVADEYDIYYTATLNNGTQTGWAKNGTTCGSINQNLYIVGLRLAFFEKGTEPGLNLSNPVSAAHADGIQYIDGAMRYIHGDGSNYTGWGWIGEDRYYFVDSYPVTGWQYIDGYKYYFGDDGKMWADVESLVGTAGPFKLKINKEMNCLTVYAQDGGNGFIIPVKSFLVSTGDDTPLGTFKTPAKYRWQLMINDVYTQYATRLGSGLRILMHSIIYDAKDPYTVWASTYNNLGIARSAGCIRLTTADSKWIYDHCSIGTVVEVYESKVPGPFERPTIEKEIPFEQTWDPTDPNVTPEGIQAATDAAIARVAAQNAQ